MEDFFLIKAQYLVLHTYKLWKNHNVVIKKGGKNAPLSVYKLIN